ncbi:MAG: HlyD family efflux transporter periplasmic adaptor subunit [Aquabacterium sp.]
MKPWIPALRRSRGFILGAATSALAVSAAWATWTALGHDAPPPEVFKGNGRLEIQRIEVATKFAGKILTVDVNEGQAVKAGDVIAHMDSSDLEAQLAGVQAMRQRAMQAMGRAQGEVQVQSIKAKVAQLELDNAFDLRKQSLVSDSELQRRQAQRDGERAGISIATSAMGEARAAKEEAEAGMLRLKQAIADHTLRAPVDGRIEHRIVEPGSVIPAGGRVATVLDTKLVHMTVFVPSEVAGKLRIGDDARIVLDAAPELPLPAHVSFVSSDAQFTPKHVETRNERDRLTYRVRLTVPEDVALRHANLLKGGLTGMGHVRVAARTPDAEPEWPDAASGEMRDRRDSQDWPQPREVRPDAAAYGQPQAPAAAYPGYPAYPPANPPANPPTRQANAQQATAPSYPQPNPQAYPPAYSPAYPQPQPYPQQAYAPPAPQPAQAPSQRR